MINLRTIQGHHSDQIMQVDTDIRSAKEELSNAIEDAITYVDANSEVLEDFLDVRMAPIGTIVGWTPKPNPDSETFVAIPTGWQLCDGSQIMSGPWIGQTTPDLTSDGGRFLRGGTADTVLAFENDQMQDHVHIDPGHSHANASHVHGQDPHSHRMDPFKGELPTFVGAPSCDSGPFTKLEHDWGWCMNGAWDMAGASANIHSAKASIQASISISNVGSVDNAYRKGDETRPKNMRVIFIMHVE